jgi:hypothetical protein
MDIGCWKLDVEWQKKSKSFSPRIDGISGILEEEQVSVRQNPF